MESSSHTEDHKTESSSSSDYSSGSDTEEFILTEYEPLRTVQYTSKLTPLNDYTNSMQVIGRMIWLQEKFKTQNYFVGKEIDPILWLTEPKDHAYWHIGYPDKLELCLTIYWHPDQRVERIEWTNRKIFEPLIDQIKKISKRISFGIIVIDYMVGERKGNDIDYISDPESHHNAFIVDRISETFERFEPLGYHKYNEPQRILNIVSQFMDNWFSGLCARYGWQYISPDNYSPVFGPQTIQGQYEMEIIDSSLHASIEELNKGEMKLKDSCSLWSCWYLESKLTNPDIPTKQLLEDLYNGIQQKTGPYPSWTHFIYEYQKRIYKILQEIYSKTAEKLKQDT